MSQGVLVVDMIREFDDGRLGSEGARIATANEVIGGW